MEDDPKRTAGELFDAEELEELDDEVRDLLREDPSPRDFVDRLIERELYPDAVKVLARALPKRTAVEWLCSCVRSELDDSAKALDVACLDAAEAWVADSSEANRCTALETAASSGLGNPFAWAAAAAGWSGGSLSPPELPPVAPSERLTSQAVAGAIIVLAAGEPEEFEKRQLAYLKTGLKLSRGP